jgi:3-methyladenine DNA glycosylase Tag
MEGVDNLCRQELPLFMKLEETNIKTPERMQPTSLGDYLAVMSKAIFQAGISWRVVESKWPGIREAFRGFDPEVVSKLNLTELDELTEDKRIIRNRRKIEAIVQNAQRILELDKSFGSFQNYLRSHNSFHELLKDLHKQFKFLGETGSYYFLWVVGEDVPPHEAFMASRGRQRPP